MPHPRSHVHREREISGGNGRKPRCGRIRESLGRDVSTEYCWQRKLLQKPDSVPAKTSKRMAARFYQLKTGHFPAGQCLKWTKETPPAMCWWCPYKSQWRDFGASRPEISAVEAPTEDPRGGIRK